MRQKQAKPIPHMPDKVCASTTGPVSPPPIPATKVLVGKAMPRSSCIGSPRARVSCPVAKAAVSRTTRTRCDYRPVPPAKVLYPECRSPILGKQSYAIPAPTHVDAHIRAFHCSDQFMYERKEPILYRECMPTMLPSVERPNEVLMSWRSYPRAGGCDRKVSSSSWPFACHLDD